GPGRRLRSERPGMPAVFLTPAVDAAAGAKGSWFLSTASRPDSADAARSPASRGPTMSLQSLLMAFRASIQDATPCLTSTPDPPLGLGRRPALRRLGSPGRGHPLARPGRRQD